MRDMKPESIYINPYAQMRISEKDFARTLVGALAAHFVTADYLFSPSKDLWLV